MAAGTTMPDPVAFATAWIAAWNSRDVEAVLRWFADDVTFTSPTALRVVPDSGGVIAGKAALRAYWNTALGTNADLKFTLEAVYAGISTIAIHYRNQHDSQVVEILTFTDGLVTHGHATHRLAVSTPQVISG